MKRTGILLILAAVMSLGVASVPLAASTAGAPDATGQRTVAARATGPTSVTPVFVLDRRGYTAFDVPFGQGFAGDAVAINDRGQITGAYDNPPNGCLRGFLRDQRSRFSRFDVPGATNTQPVDINNQGQIVGTYRVSADCRNGPLHAFMRDARGRYTTIRIPGAQQVQAFGINNRAEVAGGYVAADGTTHGFVWSSGHLTTVDGPAGATDVQVTDLNDRGQLVGVYADRAGVPHAFSRRYARYTTIDVPGAVFTIPFGVNNLGQIAGFTAASLPVTEDSDAHGFALRDGVDGPASRVDFPDAVTGTVATDINDTGTIVGVYGNPDPGESAKRQEAA